MADHRSTSSPAGLRVRFAGQAGKCLLAAMLLLGSAFATAASAASAAAGTPIHNTVTMSYVQGGSTLTGTASTSFVVDQLVDVTTTWQDAKPVQAAAGSAAQTLLFRVTNPGNGNDSYKLVPTALPASGSDFAVDQCQLFLDQDHNGIRSANDPEYVPGSNDPVLAAGDHMDVFVLCALPATANDGTFAQVRLAATSNTFSGTPGSAKPSAGIPGMNVVVGMSSGSSSSNGTYQASSVSYQFTSTQRVTDKSGGSVATSGSHILYTLIVTADGGSAIGRNLVVTNPMPEHTTYVPGSLTLDSASLGDSNTDSDAGDFNITATNAISVRLGNVPGSASPHTITFEVTIN
ncbi:hypothetical protein [Rhodanobacter spathiphylli]|uniref:DUF11 domain-containing protein n=1 Tax=Rhodanobacter spathiphylli B39 TaxID=1163407 RepID=I4W2Y5_9GAMM|nr:hypothetical protein [Rhodanobacter spathiphylli]EIL93826.1 hypothetical protein UU7_06868 [Rhodanobacter spathiphylli B39]